MCWATAPDGWCKGSRGTRPQSEFDAERVFAACAENDVAVEINSRPERQDPPDDLIQLALDAGCLFSIDSDAHAPGQLDFLQYGAERAATTASPPNGSSPRGRWSGCWSGAARGGKAVLGGSR